MFYAAMPSQDTLMGVKWINFFFQLCVFLGWYFCSTQVKCAMPIGCNGTLFEICTKPAAHLETRVGLVGTHCHISLVGELGEGQSLITVSIITKTWYPALLQHVVLVEMVWRIQTRFLENQSTQQNVARKYTQYLVNSYSTAMTTLQYGDTVLVSSRLTTCTYTFLSSSHIQL